MHSSLIMWSILSLSCVTVIVSATVDDSNGSTGSKASTAPTEKSDSPDIVNVNQDSRIIEKAIKSLETSLEKNLQRLIHVVNATSGGNRPDEPDTFSSCKEIYVNHKWEGNKAYLLQVGSVKIPVFCYMTGLGPCGGGGWTLVMKIDGAKSTFRYDSNFWSNKIDFNFPGGKTLFDAQEAKLPTYWNTPFSKICLGIKIGQQMKLIRINKRAKSLYSLIADGQYRATSLGRNTWKTLIGSQASLQLNCNREGFNVVSTSSNSYSKARIGIVGNNQNDCTSCDSRIGFGTGGTPDDSNACGNVAKYSNDNGEKFIKAMGYILVQ
ncbi:uncharacterized skeletal organic matrix protein 5-like [Orbicella faveolata]|uniref:uncharacterized skeletal organic matrix protein 5-like n=1 Tax=Orbicella faveolata TaxID=48498 RepID=UPI0009E251F1|nr:uncharacterized skeletal organic matrix protein 5-like [Orbicella faveolata]